MPVTETGSDLSGLKINVTKRNYFSNYSCEEELTLQWHLADLWMEDYMFSLHPRWEIGKKKSSSWKITRRNTETQSNEILRPPPAAEGRHPRRFSVWRHKQWTGSVWDTLGLCSERVIHSRWSVLLNESLDNDHIISFSAVKTCCSRA